LSFPKDKPAHSVNVLHKWIASYAQETGQLPERVIRQVSYMVAAQARERARDAQGALMIELRLGLRARAWKRGPAWAGAAWTCRSVASDA